MSLKNCLKVKQREVSNIQEEKIDVNNEVYQILVLKTDDENNQSSSNETSLTNSIRSTDTNCNSSNNSSDDYLIQAKVFK